MSEPTIPFGYKRITGQSQRGDGIWDGTRFAKVKKEYPHSEGRPGFNFIIRKCAVMQPELPGTAEKCIVCGGDEPCSHDFDKERQQLEAIAKTMGSEQGMCLDE